MRTSYQSIVNGRFTKKIKIDNEQELVNVEEEADFIKTPTVILLDCCDDDDGNDDDEVEIINQDFSFIDRNGELWRFVALDSED